MVITDDVSGQGVYRDAISVLVVSTLYRRSMWMDRQERASATQHVVFQSEGHAVKTMVKDGS